MIVCLILSVIAGALLIYIESRALYPVVPLKLLNTAPRGNLIFNNFFGSMAINTIIFNVPLFFQATKLETPTKSGLRLIAPSIALTAAGVSSGFIITYTRRLKPLVTLGSILVLVGSICMTCLWPDMPSWLSEVFITPANMGQGFAFPSTVMCVLAVSSQEDLAVATTTIGLSRNLGMVLGVASSSLILQNALKAYLWKMVTGPDKAETIKLVRRSVESIRHLDPMPRGQGMCF